MNIAPPSVAPAAPLLQLLREKREIPIHLSRHSVSKHHHINKDKCGNDNRPVFSHECGLIEYVSHHQINCDTNHRGMREHYSATFISHRVCVCVCVCYTSSLDISFWSLYTYYTYRPKERTICPNIPPHKLFITISALDITNISVAKIPASLLTKSLIAIIMR